MFAPRSSPDVGEKRKRPDTDPEPPRRPRTPLLHLSPPSGHRSAQVLAHSQHMPSISATWHEEARREHTAFSNESDNRTLANSAQSQARRFGLMRLASVPKETRLKGYQPQDEHSGSPAQISRSRNDNSRIRYPAREAINVQRTVEGHGDGKPIRGRTQIADMDPTKSSSHERVSKHQALPVTRSGKSYLQFKGTSTYPPFFSQCSLVSEVLVLCPVIGKPLLPFTYRQLS